MLLTLDGRRIHYDLLGPEEAPVVCMAHALSADATIWAEQVPALLAAGWRVLRLDMRGHGGSDPLGEEADMVALASDVVAVLDALEIARVHFIGLSIGGMIGQTLGVRHRDRLHSLMLCCTAPTTIPGGWALWEERFATIRAAGSVEPLADATLERWVTDDFRARRPGRWQQIRDTVAATTPAGYIAGGLAIAHFDIRAALPGITTPTLCVWGDRDPGTPPEGNRLIHAAIPGARGHEFANARHTPMVEYPDAFNGVMLEWLGSLQA
jgi:3-oxoadipate enol-lactonase